MPRKALLCVLQLDVRSVSAPAAEAAVLSRAAGWRRGRGLPFWRRFPPRFLLSAFAPVSRTVCSSGRLMRALLPSEGPLSFRTPAEGWLLGSFCPLCLHPPTVCPCAPHLAPSQFSRSYGKGLCFKRRWFLGSCRLWGKHSFKTEQKTAEETAACTCPMHPCEP